VSGLRAVVVAVGGGFGGPGGGVNINLCGCCVGVCQDCGLSSLLLEEDLEDLEVVAPAAGPTTGVGVGLSSSAKKRRKKNKNKQKKARAAQVRGQRVLLRYKIKQNCSITRISRITVQSQG
jgi:hypothetical protein